MNDAANVKQQIVERIKQSSNILVTVSRDPSVDELAAALGLTIMLNNLKKHATAVVSGSIPSALQFLEPGKTFENTVDSLRDFIIALDKEKADHLRYKVDGDVVKIFITPYRTTITEEDLDFSQGDYNVELVLALGVESKNHLDAALEAHGRILHDATVASLSAGDNGGELGSLNWHESGASSISEMLVSLSEALKGDKPVLDEQTATAFLTGIVAATDRFSNNKTSSKVMTMAAQLMAAGANQQLIAAKLEEAHEISGDSPDSSGDSGEGTNTDGTTDLSEDTSSKIDKKAASKAKKPKVDENEKSEEAPKDDGSLSITHDTEAKLQEATEEFNQQEASEAAEKAEDALASQLKTVAPAAASAAPSVSDLQKDIAAASSEVEEAAKGPAIDVSNSAAEVPMPDYEPIIGGTLNATTEQAAEDKRREEENTQNHTILSHDNVGQGGVSESVHNTGPVFTPPPFSAATDAAKVDDSIVSPFASEPIHDNTPSVTPPSAVETLTPPETLADLDKKNRGAPHEDARAAVDAAFASAPFAPSNNPEAGIGAQPLGDALQPPVASPDVAAPPATDLPPLPDFTALPPPPPPVFTAPGGTSVNEAPAGQLGQIFGETPTAPPPPQPNDPAQFKIPGQS